ncbi:ribosome biogenesis GTPase Der [Miniphocaeibacter halophilus]|uniref:Ribosome biogenesis GTPase Der n=1 Tax=Miniphocaeibacter halophilus TaxID=2931922 RepID=A0AC61MZR7_9FIRM|nr:ribosome biogenesis GTPase Der [Miniphocaeibacter halophilus]QQK07538.1 ribosome biogenesis GTPase Der [Miniphocaeibacter halophilus]
MKKPIVAIVGRPNVGKSTLFNRIVGKRVAITQDDPGVTRDRLYQEAEWQNRYFSLVDTGGIEIDAKERFSKEIINQVELAIDTAEIILFVVDGRTGITPDDREIANLLRKSKKEIILVVNKIDNKKFEDNIYEFYELGIENIKSISAENSMGLGDLLDDIVEKFPVDLDVESDEDITKVAIIGKPNVGKSSLINRLLGEERMIVTDIAGTTRDSIDSKFKYNGEDYILVDTAGLRRKRAINEEVERFSVVRTLDAIDKSDICVLMIDAKEGVTEQDSKIIGYAHDQGKAMIISVNKWDLVEKDNKSYTNFEREIRNKLGFINYVPIIFMSVKNNLRVYKLFELIEQINNNYSMRISTGILNDIINDAILHNPPPTDKGERLKIFYITQVAVRPPKFIIYVNKSSLMHFSYIRYIENQIRENFHFTGVPLIFELRERGD